MLILMVTFGQQYDCTAGDLVMGISGLPRLLVSEMALLILLMGVALKQHQILTLLYVGSENSCPRDTKIVSFVDV